MTGASEISVCRVGRDEYDALFPQRLTVFDRTCFAELNSARADAVEYLTLRDSSGKALAGWIAGRRYDMLLAPFSAPYSAPAVSANLSVAQWLGCANALREYSGGKMRLTLPPDFYAPELLPAVKAALLSAGAELLFADYNYHADVASAADPDAVPSRTARQELRRAIDSPGIRYEILDPESKADIARVYAVIEANHRGKGYPVKMSLGLLTDTFLMLGGLLSVVTCDGHDAAAQIGYFSSGHIYQPVYWGDLSPWTRLHPMRLLFHGLAKQLREDGRANIIDLGPSSENGIPATGLCAFKKSLGCLLSIKPTLVL